MEKSFFERANYWMRNSITVRLITIGILILIMLIPVSMVEDLIYERERRQQDAIGEISSKWGKSQTITGLILTVPYYVTEKVYDQDETDKYKLVRSIEYAHFFPDDLAIEGVINSEVRYRGIFEVVVYNSDIAIKGNFKSPSFSDWNIIDDILWEDAFVSLGLSDLRGLQSSVELSWNSSKLYFEPGVETNDVISSGISVKVPLDFKDTTNTVYEFDCKFNFNGSSSLDFVPLGIETNVTINSTWADPKFDGAFLPDNHDIRNDGFTANWNILNLNRSYPQKFRNTVGDLYSSEFGVNLFMPIDNYKKSRRSVKYTVLFISLTFLVFFFIQILNHVRIHPIQYIIVGLALCIFYTLLVSISEHLNFMIAYFLASIVIISIITAYAKSMFKSNLLAGLMGLILIVLYGFIYTIIQLQDFALLIGSLGLLIVLATVMYLSRNVDWYALHKGKDETIK